MAPPGTSRTYPRDGYGTRIGLGPGGGGDASPRISASACGPPAAPPSSRRIAFVPVEKCYGGVQLGPRIQYQPPMKVKMYDNPTTLPFTVRIRGRSTALPSKYPNCTTDCGSSDGARAERAARTYDLDEESLGGPRK